MIMAAYQLVQLIGSFVTSNQKSGQAIGEKKLRTQRKVHIVQSVPIPIEW